MNQILQNKIRKQLREASNYGARGFYFDYSHVEEEQDEDWMYFEDMCIGEIEDLELRVKLEGE